MLFVTHLFTLVTLYFRSFCWFKCLLSPFFYIFGISYHWIIYITLCGSNQHSYLSVLPEEWLAFILNRFPYFSQLLRAVCYLLEEDILCLDSGLPVANGNIIRNVSVDTIEALLRCIDLTTLHAFIHGHHHVGWRTGLSTVNTGWCSGICGITMLPGLRPFLHATVIWGHWKLEFCIEDSPAASCPIWSGFQRKTIGSCIGAHWPCPVDWCLRPMNICWIAWKRVVRQWWMITWDVHLVRWIFWPQLQHDQPLVQFSHLISLSCCKTTWGHTNLHMWRNNNWQYNNNYNAFCSFHSFVIHSTQYGELEKYKHYS